MIPAIQHAVDTHEAAFFLFIIGALAVYFVAWIIWIIFDPDNAYKEEEYDE